MELITETLDAVGTILIAWMAISVHRRVLHEHKVDSRVFRTMKAVHSLHERSRTATALRTEGRSH